MKQKNLYPFRLGSTSYVYPYDIVPNVRKMAPYVDDIEIILFQSEEDSNLPGKEAVTELSELAQKHALTYTIHFPIDKDAGSADRMERKLFSNQVERIIEMTRPLEPYGYILHLQGVDDESSLRERELWLKACDEVCRSIAKIPRLESQRICVENLFYPMAWHMDLVARYNFSICMDIGHLLRSGEERYEDIFAKYLAKTRIIHLHGVCDGRDHISLKNSELDDIIKLISMSKKFQYHHIVTLELFNSNDTFESIKVLEELWQKSV